METKAWYQSKTIWGAIIMFICLVVGQITGVQIGQAEQDSAVTTIVGLAQGVGVLVGLFLTIYGRIKATKKITVSPETAAKVIVLCLMGVLLTGCAGFVSNTYKTEYVAGSAYNLAAVGIKNLNASGNISPDQLAKIYKVGAICYNSYEVSVDALIAYSKAPDSSIQSIVTTSLEGLVSSWADLSALVNSIAPGTISGVLTLKGTNSVGKKYTVSVKKLTSGEIQIIIQVGMVVLEYIFKEGMDIYNALQKSNITIDDLTALKTMIKPLDQY